MSRGTLFRLNIQINVMTIKLALWNVKQILTFPSRGDNSRNCDVFVVLLNISQGTVTFDWELYEFAVTQVQLVDPCCLMAQILVN